MLDWKLTGEVRIVDMGNGFNFVKFTNVIDCNNDLEGQPWFVGGQICSLKRGKQNFDLHSVLL